MLRPAPMTRALLVGPRDALEGVIETLYSLELVHIVDHREGEYGLDIGRPLRQASEASEVLVKLRSIASVLHVEEPKGARREQVSGDIRAKILALELNISEEDSARKKTQALLADLNRRIEELTPFASLPLDLADYRGYESLEVLVGRTNREVEDLSQVTQEYEAFGSAGFLAVFVAKAHAGAVRDVLARAAFTPVAVPEGDGRPDALVSGLSTEKERWERRLADIEGRLGTLRERYAGFLAAAKAHLEVQVEKAEAPLRFAVTEHSFVVEGWVPTDTFPALTSAVAKIPEVHLSELETDAHAADPPVLLRNARPLRPFEFFVKLFSTPSYKEIDPTFIVAIGFPIFFGIMIGDAGYGAVWLVFGALLLQRIKTPGMFRDLIISITVGGFFAFLFGMFFFAEAFGVPFHEPPEALSRAEQVTWSSILGFDIPIRATIEKLHQVPDFIVLAIAASFLHLGAAYVIGLFNEVGHNKKHAVGKVSWLLILTGMFVLIIVRAARWPGMGRTIWNGPLAWFPRGSSTFGGISIFESLGFDATANPVPDVAVFLLIAGLVLLLATESGLAIMEVFGLLANMISYARLAAVGVAKAAMAFAFNVIALEVGFFPWLDTGDVVALVLGCVVLVIFHLIIFLLGAVSAAIQSIRLNYVEFFIKFFKGSGTLFRPFGMRTQLEV
ncbi:MAG: V-type ATP synthase subunit I [Methanobacteriota archaeon]